MPQFSEKFQPIFMSIVFIVVAFIVIKIVKRAIFNLASLTTDEKAKPTGIYMYNTIKYILIVLTAFIIMQMNGIDVSSAIAGLGIATVIIGFALQEYLRDIIMGYYIVTEKFFKIGDTIKYKDIEGNVTNLTLKTTTIETISCHNKVTICNRNINEITKLSEEVNIDIPLPYELNAENSRTILRETCTKIKEQDDIYDAIFKGTQEFGDSAIIYRITIKCKPSNRDQLRRNSLTTIQDVLDQNGIKIPYQQIDIHNK